MLILDLLQQIHRGVNLKKIDRDAIKREQEEMLENSVATLSDLGAILSRALDHRSAAMLGDDGSDSWSSE